MTSSPSEALRYERRIMSSADARVPKSLMVCASLLYFVLFSSQITKNTRTLLVSHSHTHLIDVSKYHIHVHGRKLSKYIGTGHLEN